MPNPDEAREQAWREMVRALPAPPSRDDVVSATEAFWATLDEPPTIDAMNALIALSETVARREVWKALRDDQQRIAALVKWAEDILNTGDIGLVLYERGEALLSALGQPEEVER